MRILSVLTLLAFVLSTCTSSANNLNRQLYKTILKYLDQNADPCEDYYQYACGNWESSHKNKNYYETIGFIDHLANENFLQIFEIIADRSWTKQYFVKKAVDYMRSCVGVESYQPVKYLRWLRDRENITWPTPVPRKSSTTSNNYDFMRMLAITRKYGLNGVFLEETIMPRGNDARQSIIDIDKPVLQGGFKPLTNSGFEITLEYLGVTERSKRQKLWKTLHEFELKLLELLDLEDTTGDHLKSLAELKLPWLESYLDTVMETTVDRQMKISIQNLPYLEALQNLLAEYSPEFICRYLMVRFVWHLNVDGPKNFLLEDCIAHLRGSLPLTMHWLYEEHNPQLASQKEEVKALFRKLIEHFKMTINENINRFNETILEFLYNKIDAMRIKIGNLPLENTTDILEDFYRNLSIDSTNFYANHLRILYFYNHAMHDQLNRLVAGEDKFFFMEDSETGASSSPYYLLRSNIVILPLTLLNPPIYQAGMLNVFKYSSLGFLLAHEITHGFDESGVDFDQNGNMRGPSEVIKENSRFDGRLKCLSSRSPEFVDEKIADVSGLRWAYETYKNSTAGAAEPMRWSDFSADKLFFLNFAQFFCGIANQDSVEFSEHGTDHDRVLDALAHFAEFANVHSCPGGTRMNPVRRCQLWR